MREQQRRHFYIITIRLMLACIVAQFVYQFSFLRDLLTLTLASLVWVPQIFKNYRNRQKNCPNMYFVVVVSASHLFFPLYLRGCPDSLFDRPYSISFCVIISSVMALQALILRGQQKLNPRFFIPKKYRRRLNEYNYYHEFPEQAIPNDTENNQIEEDEDCIICMTSLRIEQDS